MGILYYAIYNPLRKRKPPLEVYKLEKNQYILLKGMPIWLPELNLAIGREEGTYQGITREWLYWYDAEGERYLTPEETIQDARQQELDARKRELDVRQQVNDANLKIKRLEAKLRELGINPDRI